MKAQLADGAFAGVEPARDDVRLQVSGGGEALVCCTIAHERWKKASRRTYRFRDRAATICPPIKKLSLTFPRRTPARATIGAGNVDPPRWLQALEITLGGGGRCVSGAFALRSKSKRQAVFP